MKKLVIGMGEALWDVFPEGKKIGGAPANFAYHVSQFGIESCVISAVGNDSLGHEILHNFTEKQLHYNVPCVDFPTGTVQVTLDERGVPCYEITEGVAWDNIPFTPAIEALAHDTYAVCFGSLAQRSTVSHDTINRFLDAMPADADHYKIFDINLRQHFYSKAIIEESLRKCNVLKINDEELEIVTPMLALEGDNYEARCRQLLRAYNLRIVILTCGTDGSYVFTDVESSFLPTPRVEVADTVGAGDSFTAAFVASILLGKTIPEAHAAAVNVSAFVCTQSGAMPILPTELTQA